VLNVILIIHWEWER